MRTSRRGPYGPGRDDGEKAWVATPEYDKAKICCRGRCTEVIDVFETNETCTLTKEVSYFPKGIFDDKDETLRMVIEVGSNRAIKNKEVAIDIY